MSSWRALAAVIVQRDAEQPTSAETFGLPSELAASLRSLEALQPPRKLERPECWAEVVEDAMRIVRDGWAAKALALGWSAYDLFGVGPIDDWEFSGLAVWLNGRDLVLLDSRCAVARPPDGRGDFVRGGMGHGTHPTITPVLLWEFGR